MGTVFSTWQAARWWWRWVWARCWGTRWRRMTGRTWRGRPDGSMALASLDKPLRCCFSYAGVMNSAASEVIATTVVPRMMHLVLVENWEAEKAVEEAHTEDRRVYVRHQHQWSKTSGLWPHE